MSEFHFHLLCLSYAKLLIHFRCLKQHYKKTLPTVSVIINFFDEHLTTLLRSVHSIANRSPPELLKEIILVNDGSTKEALYEDLKTHLDEQPWGKKVVLFMMQERIGVIWSRLAGARYATGDVLLFMDCHIEAGYNFLPPLIDPIASNYRAVVIPTLDIIDKNTYEIKPLGEGRTVFDWNFHAQRIPLPNHTHSNLFKTPMMYGATFAISAKYYWELQPDSGLVIYGGDQLELSFKVNLCGGLMYETPCSRVGHIYRRFPYLKHQNEIDYKAR
jgi:polypeptide N-acetylgalactosaminyltransferase